MSTCMLCPRHCPVDRAAGQTGYCGSGAQARVCRTLLHRWEEPVLTGENGAGAVFFAGCNLRCVYCQNRAISHTPSAGEAVSVAELSEIFLHLQCQGAACIDLVTPTPYADKVGEALEMVRMRLTVPVVWNCGGYESVQMLQRLDGLVDVYMPDFKYCDPEIASALSGAADYADAASEALREMFRQTGKYRMENGILRRGILVRHLVLPGFRHDSMAVLSRIAATVPVDGVLLSLMSQYTPDFAVDAPQKSLHRTLTSFEYDSVLTYAQSLGFDGFMQARSSASAAYTPDF